MIVAVARIKPGFVGEGCIGSYRPFIDIEFDAAQKAAQYPLDVERVAQCTLEEIIDKLD